MSESFTAGQNPSAEQRSSRDAQTAGRPASRSPGPSSARAPAFKIVNIDVVNSEALSSGLVTGLAMPAKQATTEAIGVKKPMTNRIATNEALASSKCERDIGRLAALKVNASIPAAQKRRVRNIIHSASGRRMPHAPQVLDWAIQPAVLGSCFACPVDHYDFAGHSDRSERRL